MPSKRSVDEPQPISLEDAAIDGDFSLPSDSGDALATDIPEALLEEVGQPEEAQPAAAPQGEPSIAALDVSKQLDKEARAALAAPRREEISAPSPDFKEFRAATSNPFGAFFYGLRHAIDTNLGDTLVGLGRILHSETMQDVGESFLRTAETLPTPLDYLQSVEGAKPISAAAALAGETIGFLGSFLLTGGAIGRVASLVGVSKLAGAATSLGSRLIGKASPKALQSLRVLMEKKPAVALETLRRAGIRKEDLSAAYLMSLGDVTHRREEAGKETSGLDYVSALGLAALMSAPFPFGRKRMGLADPRRLKARKGDEYAREVRAEARRGRLPLAAKAAAFGAGGQAAYEAGAEAASGQELSPEAIAQAGALGGLVGGAFGGASAHLTQRRLDFLAEMLRHGEKNPEVIFMRAAPNPREAIDIAAVANLIPREFISKEVLRRIDEGEAEKVSPDELIYKPFFRALRAFVRNPDMFAAKHTDFARYVSTIIKNSPAEMFLPQRVRDKMQALQDVDSVATLVNKVEAKKQASVEKYLDSMQLGSDFRQLTPQEKATLASVRWNVEYNPDTSEYVVSPDRDGIQLSPSSFFAMRKDGDKYILRFDPSYDTAPASDTSADIPLAKEAEALAQMFTEHSRVFGGNILLSHIADELLRQGSKGRDSVSISDIMTELVSQHISEGEGSAINERAARVVANFRKATKTFVSNIVRKVLLSDNKAERKLAASIRERLAKSGFTRKELLALARHLSELFPDGNIPLNYLRTLADTIPGLAEVLRLPMFRHARSTHFYPLMLVLDGLTANLVLHNNTILLGDTPIGFITRHDDGVVHVITTAFDLHEDIADLLARSGLRGERLEIYDANGENAIGIEAREFNEATINVSFLSKPVRSNDFAVPELLRFNRFLAWTADVHQLASLNPDNDLLQRLDRLTREWEWTKQVLIERALEGLHEVEKLSKGEQEELFRFMEHETLHEDKWRVYQVTEDGVLFTNSAEETAKLSPQQYKAYMSLVRAFRLVLDSIYAAMIDKARRKGDLERVAALERELEELRKRPYLPFIRFGDYKLYVRTPDGREVFLLYETRKERDEAAAEFKARGYKVLKDVRTPTALSYAMLPEALLNSILDDPDLSKELTPHTREALRKAFVKRTSEHSARRHFLRRKKVPGYSRDLVRITGTYVFSMAHLLARIKLMDKFAELSSEIERLRRENIELRGEVGTKVVLEGGFITDTEKLSWLRHYIEEHLQHLADPREEAPFFRALTVAYYLVLHPVQWLLNLTQVPIGLAIAAARLGEKAVLRAIPEAFKLSRSRFWEEQERALEEANSKGLIDESMLMEIAGLVHSSHITASASRLTALKGRALEAIRFGMTPFHWTEVVGRKMLFRVAYTAARLAGHSHASAARHAERVIEDGMFDYSRIYRPRFMRGRFAPFTIFYTYMQKMVGLLGGAYGSKEAYYALAVFASMAGALGLPFVQNLLDIISAAYSSATGEYADFKREARKLLRDLFGADFGDLLALGAAHFGFGFLPFTLTESMGLGRLMPGVEAIARPSANATPEERVLAAAEDIGGAGISMLVRLLAAALNPSDWWTMRRAMPRFLRNIAEAHDVAEYGGLKLPNDTMVYVNPYDEAARYIEALARLMGTDTRDFYEKLEARYDTKAVMAFYEARRVALMRDLRYALLYEGDEGVAEVMREIAVFNAAAPPKLRIEVSRKRMQRWLLEQDILGGELGTATPSRLLGVPRHYVEPLPSNRPRQPAE